MRVENLTIEHVRKAQERFWKRLDIAGEDDCWLFTKARPKREPITGYGLFSLSGIVIPSHRMAYMAHHGELIGRKLVRHLCHNKSCCNPRHLALGDHWDNIQDEINAGKTHKNQGEAHPLAKLDNKLVEEIRWLYARQYTAHEISKELGMEISPAQISMITKGKTWGLAPGPVEGVDYTSQHRGAGGYRRGVTWSNSSKYQAPAMYT